MAGAGPVGLTAALALRRRGVAVTVLERGAGLATASRASTFHSPSLALLDELGVLAEVRPRGHPVTAIGYYTVAGGPLASFPLRLLASHTPYPLRLHVEQSIVAAALARRLDGCIRFHAEVVAVAPDEAGVAVTVRSAGGAERTERGSFLVAADGARSAVRAASSIAFEGEEYPHRVLRVMTQDDLGALIPGLASISYIFDEAGSCSLLRMPDVWRVIFRIPAGESDAEALDEARIRERLRRFLPRGGEAVAIASTDIYRVGRRVAARYRAGRVLIAGDAAHITNTRGGMNMNCGLQDAVSAAEAIALACEDPPDGEAALARYACERRRVATEMLLPRTDRTVTGGAAWLETIRTAAADPASAERFLLGSSMLDMSGPRFPARAKAAA
ncbi:MAG: FAD-dependent monooxygenase [Acetobacteraceae bacterium]|nr:FAD-dependent monooxygenase [Acetobacteraceae bacterium]